MSNAKLGSPENINISLPILPLQLAEFQTIRNHSNLNSVNDKATICSLENKRISAPSESSTDSRLAFALNMQSE